MFPRPSRAFDGIREDLRQLNERLRAVRSEAGELLDAAVRVVGNVDVALGVRCDPPRIAQAPCGPSRAPEDEELLARLVELAYLVSAVLDDPQAPRRVIADANGTPEGGALGVVFLGTDISILSVKPVR